MKVGVTDGGLAHSTTNAIIVRITAGNFHLVDRFITKLDRGQTMNDLNELPPSLSRPCGKGPIGH